MTSFRDASTTRRAVDAQAPQPTWNGLLGLFAREGRDPGRVYEEVRERLIRFFSWRGCAFPDVLADRTFERVESTLASGVQVMASEPLSYVLGVARFIHLEAVRAEARAQAVVHELSRGEPDADRAGDDARLRALEGCLASLQPDERALLLRYYQFFDQPERQHRTRLAAELGIEVNTLRMRVHRLCTRVVHCVKECLHERD